MSLTPPQSFLYQIAEYLEHLNPLNLIEQALPLTPLERVAWVEYVAEERYADIMNQIVEDDPDDVILAMFTCVSHRTVEVYLAKVLITFAVLQSKGHSEVWTALEERLSFLEKMDTTFLEGFALLSRAVDLRKNLLATDPEDWEELLITSQSLDIPPIVLDGLLFSIIYLSQTHPASRFVVDNLVLGWYEVDAVAGDSIAIHMLRRYALLACDERLLSRFVQVEEPFRRPLKYDETLAPKPGYPPTFKGDKVWKGYVYQKPSR